MGVGDQGTCVPSPLTLCSIFPPRVSSSSESHRVIVKKLLNIIFEIVLEIQFNSTYKVLCHREVASGCALLKVPSRLSADAVILLLLIL